MNSSHDLGQFDCSRQPAIDITAQHGLTILQQLEQHIVILAWLFQRLLLCATTQPHRLVWYYRLEHGSNDLSTTATLIIHRAAILWWHQYQHIALLLLPNMGCGCVLT